MLLHEHIQLMFGYFTDYYMKDAGHGKNLIYNNKLSSKSESPNYINLISLFFNKQNYGFF